MPRSAGFGQFGSGACGVQGCDGFNAQHAQVFGTLRQCLRVGGDGLDISQLGSRQGQQAMIHRLEVLADHMQAGLRHQPVDLFHTTGGGVFQRDHGQSCFATLDHKHRFHKGLARLRRQFGVHPAAGKVGVGALMALVGDGGIGGHGFHTFTGETRSIIMAQPLRQLKTICAFVLRSGCLPEKDPKTRTETTANP